MNTIPYPLTFHLMPVSAARMSSLRIGRAENKAKIMKSLKFIDSTAQAHRVPLNLRLEPIDEQLDFIATRTVSRASNGRIDGFL